MRRRHRKIAGAADLDITAFMNLMIVLVPVLLINMVFAQTSILDLRFPTGQGAATEDISFQLQVIIQPDQILVSDNQGGVIKAISLREGQHDYEMLRMVMKEIKARMPEEKAVTIMPVASTSYQNLVTVMDTVRSYRTVVAGSLVNAELFPDISIADAPAIDETAQLSSSLQGEGA